MKARTSRESTKTPLPIRSKKYVEGDLAGLLKEHYRKPKSQLEPCNERLRTLFEKQPPHTVNHAIEMIFEETGGA